MLIQQAMDALEALAQINKCYTELRDVLFEELNKLKTLFDELTKKLIDALNSLHVKIQAMISANPTSATDLLKIFEKEAHKIVQTQRDVCSKLRII